MEEVQWETHPTCHMAPVLKPYDSKTAISFLWSIYPAALH